MRYLFLLIGLFVANMLLSQSIRGKITDQQTGKPLADALIYIGNTSIATNSDASGNYELKQIPDANYQLVCSLVGYELEVKSSENLNGAHINFALRHKDDNLETVVIQSYDPNGWKKWGKAFLDNFIGTLPFSNQCVIDNKDDVKFRFHKKSNTLEVIALAPLQITNKYLGYKIHYDLVSFSNNFQTHFIYYAGFPVFKDISETKNKRYQISCLEHRKETYLGSQMHFLRSVYKNTSAEQGFEMRRLEIQVNKEKQRILNIKIPSQLEVLAQGNLYENKPIYSADSIAYFEKVKRQRSDIAILHPEKLYEKDILKGEIDSTKGKIFHFSDKLLIEYPHKSELPEYAQFNFNHRVDAWVTAMLSTNKEKDVLIFSDGSFYPPTDLLLEGYWSWSEKISTMLPLDYQDK